MILEPINLSTGPVSISPEVKKAFCGPPVSHRSTAFRNLFDKMCDQICSMFSVSRVFVMSGSGTLANETMLHQVKMTGAKGLILSNGEFGSRLINQANRIELNYQVYDAGWGGSFDIEKLRQYFSTGGIKWVLFCHCETSTGVVNDLDAISRLCAEYQCQCFVDCISSVGNLPLNLSNVSMATASSGKGLASYAGLALVMSNIEPVSNEHIPIYFDIAHYATKSYIPFTISSNLVSALYTSIVQKTAEFLPEIIQKYSGQYFETLQAYNLVPFGNAGSRVFSIVLPDEKNKKFIDEMQNRNILLSYESEYLKKRNWSQLAVFGYYHENQLQQAHAGLEQSLKKVFAG